MQKEILEKYLQAGKIAKQVLEHGCRLAKENMSVVKLAEAIEAKIFELGAKPAFPVNIGINEIAAHYSPALADKTVLHVSDYIKIDVGVHIDGYIADTTCTLRLAGKDLLIECSEKMLSEALKLFVPGAKMSDIGETIENVAKEFGFNPVRNLTGHGLAQYNLHAGVTVPNIKIASSAVLQEDEVYAVEPFCTKGAGAVKDSEQVLIFKWLADKPVRSAEARKILELGKKQFLRLPFAKRWLEKQFSPLRLELALRQLVEAGALHPYYILKEVSCSAVAQAEHTVIVAEKPIVTTI